MDIIEFLDELNILMTSKEKKSWGLKEKEGRFRIINRSGHTPIQHLAFIKTGTVSGHFDSCTALGIGEDDCKALHAAIEDYTRNPVRRALERICGIVKLRRNPKFRKSAKRILAECSMA